LIDDRGSPLEAHGAETAADVVAPRASPGERLECQARGLKAVDVAAGNLVPRLLGNEGIEPEEVGFRERPEAELKFSHFRAAFTWLE
jgi:hypothetical protein